MIICRYMHKAEKDRCLPLLFDLYYGNMQHIAPSGKPYEEERTCWLSEVSPALEKAPRQVILCLADDQLIGYIQYYTRDKLLMVEEFQISPSYRGTLLFHKMCKYLGRYLPADIEQAEAYADIRNCASRSIMRKLGFLEFLEVDCPGFVHLRADFTKVRRHFTNSR